MKDYQQRVIDEKAELDERREKLNSFFGGSIYSGLDHDEQSRLQLQGSLIKMLSDVLEPRICAFSE